MSKEPEAAAVLREFRAYVNRCEPLNRQTVLALISSLEYALFGLDGLGPLPADALRTAERPVPTCRTGEPTTLPADRFHARDMSVSIGGVPLVPAAEVFAERKAEPAPRSHTGCAHHRREIGEPCDVCGKVRAL